MGNTVFLDMSIEQDFTGSPYHIRVKKEFPEKIVMQDGDILLREAYTAEITGWVSLDQFKMMIDYDDPQALFDSFILAVEGMPSGDRIVFEFNQGLKTVDGDPVEITFFRRSYWKEHHDELHQANLAQVLIDVQKAIESGEMLTDKWY